MNCSTMDENHMERPVSDRLFHWFLSVSVLVIISLTALGMSVTRTTVALGPLIPRVALLFVLLGLAVYYRRRKETKLSNLFIMVFWSVIITNIHIYPMNIASRFKVEMRDATLAKIDRVIGLEVPEILDWSRSYPAMDRFLTFCYDTLISLMTLAIIMPSLAGRTDVAKRFTLACLISATISIPVFAFFQAVGPWEYYHYKPSISQVSYMETLAKIKSYYHYEIDPNYVNGLICFPSFHTVLAVLAASALQPFRYIRFPALLLAVLIVVSTVTTGTHYIVDVAGGLVVAVISLAAASWLLRGEKIINSRIS